MSTPKPNPPPTSPAVLSELRSLSKKLDSITQLSDDLSTKTLELELRLRASEHNSVARLANATSSAAPLALEPLKAKATNEGIEGFPRTEKEFRIMSASEVISILKALDVSIQGTAGERKARLRAECGVAFRHS